MLHLCKEQVSQLDLDRHFQLDMLCSFQIFLLKSTFPLDMELVDYLNRDNRNQQHKECRKCDLVYFGNLVDKAYRHFHLGQKKYQPYS